MRIAQILPSYLYAHFNQLATKNVFVESWHAELQLSICISIEIQMIHLVRTLQQHASNWASLWKNIPVDWKLSLWIGNNSINQSLFKKKKTLKNWDFLPPWPRKQFAYICKSLKHFTSFQTAPCPFKEAAFGCLSVTHSMHRDLFFPCVLVY